MTKIAGPLSPRSFAVRLMIMDQFNTVTRSPSAFVTSEESANDILWVTYRWMSVGLAITGAVAFLVAHSPAAVELLLSNRAR